MPGLGIERIDYKKKIFIWCLYDLLNLWINVIISALCVKDCIHQSFMESAVFKTKKQCDLVGQ